MYSKKGERGRETGRQKCLENFPFLLKVETLVFFFLDYITFKKMAIFSSSGALR